MIRKLDISKSTLIFKIKLYEVLKEYPGLKNQQNQCTISNIISVKLN